MQLHLFPTIVKGILLKADSPRKAWWRLMLEECQGKYTIIKESGAGSKTLDVRRWSVSPDKAEKIYNKKVQSKLDPNRKNPRKYRRCRWDMQSV